MRDLFSEWEMLDDASGFDYHLVDTPTLRRMKGIAKRACLQGYSTGGNRLRLLEATKITGLDAINIELGKRGLL